MIESYFGIKEKNSTVAIEILAGVSTFLSLSYIFVVNPAILSQAGMDKSFVLFATIIASAIATIAMGLWARLPFVLAPGMEMNAYVAFFVVGTLGLSWQQALGAVFWSGILFVILTVTRVREKIIAAIPDPMKSALSLSVGVFLALVAFKVSGILRYEGIHIQGLGSLVSPLAIALYVGLALVLILERLKVRAAVLISIVLTTLLCHFMGVGRDAEEPAKMSTAMLNGIGQLDLGVILNPKSLSAILILFLIDFYGSIAKFIGLSMNTNIMKDGRLPRMREALLIDGVATNLGSFLGTSSIIVYVESGIGIGAGGRTGITALTCGFLMLACFLISPALKFIPVVATTGALVYVALKLCPRPQQLQDYTKSDIAIMIVMLLTVLFTFAIDRAMLAGFAGYLAMNLLDRRKPSPYLMASLFALILGAVLQML